MPTNSKSKGVVGSSFVSAACFALYCWLSVSEPNTGSAKTWETIDGYDRTRTPDIVENIANQNRISQIEKESISRLFERRQLLIGKSNNIISDGVKGSTGIL